MSKRRQPGLDFEIDKLTNSVENVVTGDSFSTDIIDTIAALKLINKYFPK